MAEKKQTFPNYFALPTTAQFLKDQAAVQGILQNQPLQLPKDKHLMATRKFKDGDTVQTTREIANGTIHKGIVGTVRHYDQDHGYSVEFEPSDVDSTTYLHLCDGYVPNGYGYNLTTDQLTLAPHKIKVDFNTVVIADEKRQQILEALEQIHQQTLIFETWGFKNTVEKGRGVAMLFYGPPGTGKTLMGQAIADKLGAQLKVIGTAEIQSSEPGQAERNIKELFKLASGKNTVLFFDECDSLVFDRTVVGAILGAQVNTLLSCLEKHEGVCIFTTNRIETLDEAVNRRLALKLEFAMPDHEQRAEIWKRMFPKECPKDDDIDFMKLATVEIAGGHIKNTILRAARIAAMEKLTDTDKKIKMAHLVRALKEEALSMDAFNKAKEKFNIPGIRGYGAGIGMTENRNLSVDTKMVSALSAIGGN